MQRIMPQVSDHASLMPIGAGNAWMMVGSDGGSHAVSAREFNAGSGKRIIIVCVRVESTARSALKMAGPADIGAKERDPKMVRCKMRTRDDGCEERALVEPCDTCESRGTMTGFGGPLVFDAPYVYEKRGNFAFVPTDMIQCASNIVTKIVMYESYVLNAEGESLEIHGANLQGCLCGRSPTRSRPLAGACELNHRETFSAPIHRTCCH